MADNTELTAGSGGDTIATDDIAGVKHQRVKVQYGDDGSATDVSDTNPLPVDDAGGSLSVDDGGSSLSIDDGGNTITVDGTVAVTGVATAANQTTLIGHVDGVEGLLTTIDADTGSIATSATTLAGAVAGTEMQVDVVTMPTTTVQGTVTANLSATDNAVLDDIAADTEAIKTAVEGTLTVTGGGGGTEYTVDAAAPAAPVGTASLMERDDALSALTEVEGDWTNMRSNANGALWVKHDGTVTVDGSGVTQPVSGTVSVTGVATAANQTTIIGHVDGIEGLLTTIDGDTGTLAVTGGGTETGALRVTVANNSTGVLSVDDNGSTLSVDDGGASLTVDNGGTFAVQAAQSGTWTVQPGNTANTTAWKVDASSVAVPVTDNSGSLTVDNAGTFVVQDNQVVADNAGFTDGTTKVFVSGYVYDEVAGTALTENDAGAARMNVNRAQVGIIEDGTTRGRYATVSASNALKTDGSAVTQPVSYATTGSGTATGALRVELPTNGTGVIATVGAVTAITNALPAGSNAIGKLAANSGVDIGDVDVTTVGTITPGTGATSLGKAIDSAIGATDTGVAALAVRDDVLTTLTPADSDYTHMRTNSMGAQWTQPHPATTGGLSIFRSLDIDETEEDVKTSAGMVYGWFIYNNAATTHFVKFYNETAANVTVGTTTPVLTLPIPAGSAANVFTPHGIAFSTAICVAATTAVADNDTGAPAANAVVINVLYA